MKLPLQKIEYDKSVDALYIYAARSKVQRTLKINKRVMLDIDKQGKIVGVEILDVSKPIVQKIKTRVATA